MRIWINGQKWGASDSYDFSLNSGKLGIDGTAEIIQKLVELKERDGDKRL